jgi:hypothetical protein
MQTIRSTLLLTLSMGICSAALAEREWPETTYACQVITNSEAQGLVSIQSLSLQDAQSGAVGKPAITLAGNKGIAARVKQCIEERSGATFTDSSFQGWYARLDK